MKLVYDRLKMKLKKAFFALIILTMAVYLSANAISYKYVAKVNGSKLFLEAASTPQQRQTGLMYRSSLKANAGMLFLFEEKDNVNFWMKNVKFPLDLIFIDDFKVVKLYNNVKACYTQDCPIYPSIFSVNKVIEVNAGFCAKNKIKEGQSMKIYPITK